MTFLKSGLHINRKARKHMFESMFFLAVQAWLGRHIIVMIPSIDVSQEIFAVDILVAVKYSWKHRCKHVLQMLRPYGDKAKPGFYYIVTGS